MGRSLGAQRVSHPVAEERPIAHGDALNAIRAAVAEAPGPQAAAQRAVELLHDRSGHYDWIGVRWVEGDELVLGPWVGPQAAERPRIPLGTGGGAARAGGTRIIGDVRADPERRSGLPAARSAIAVPIFADGEMVGEIDVDGDELDAFAETDARFLEEVAALLAPLRPRA